MAQNLGNNVEPQGRGSINGGINAAAQANNVHQDWEFSSSDGESEEEPMFECKRCPGTRFTAEEKERHREMHQQPHRNMAQNRGNNVEQQVGGGNIGGGNPAAQANNVHQDWELSSSDGEAEEELMFSCRLCPGTRFTAEEKERHREMHQQRQRNRNQQNPGPANN